MGVFGSNGQKNGSVSRAVKSPSGFVRRICSRYGASTRTPEIFVAFPAITASAPTMSLRYPAATAGDSIFGFASRLNASAKLRAVTSAPLWKRNVRFRSNVYTLPSPETLNRSTTSGTTRVPAAPASSG
jgi:hypothetical protein